MMTVDDIKKYLVTEQLRDQRSITVRAIRPDDKELLREAFKELDEESIYTRFFGPRKELTEKELAWATEVDFIRNVALVVCIQEGDREKVIGGGRYLGTTGSGPPASAEVAFLVEEDYHGLGIASMVLKHLALIGREQGVSRFEAEVLPQNKAMLRVFHRSGLPVTTEPSGDSMHVTILLE
ncbi:MAG TPA: GNAT family N-acetyltransferase [Thermodesulfovibrionales bacterium]|nr:GNAT family N-acetyltransferase [Thermodesulfovibrionales bacterium]